MALGKLAFPLLLKYAAVAVSPLPTETDPPDHQVKPKLLNVAPELQVSPLRPLGGHPGLLLSWTSHQPPATPWTVMHMHPLTMGKAVSMMGTFSHSADKSSACGTLLSSLILRSVGSVPGHGGSSPDEAPALQDPSHRGLPAQYR